MGTRGAAPDYDIQITLKLTNSMNTFLDEMARMHDTSKSEIIRMLIDKEFAQAMRKEAYGA